MDPMRYRISKSDNHPSAFAHQRIAEYVVSAIIGGEWAPHVAPLDGARCENWPSAIYGWSPARRRLDRLGLIDCSVFPFLTSKSMCHRLKQIEGSHYVMIRPAMYGRCIVRSLILRKVVLGIVFTSFAVSQDGWSWAAPMQITTHTAHDYFPAWSPNVNQIAFTSDRSGNFDIWVICVRGGRAILITLFGPRVLLNPLGIKAYKPLRKI
jgi:hypothetical protein